MAGLAVKASLAKDPNERRGSDEIRIKAGRMLTLDELTINSCTAERKSMRKVVRKTIMQNKGCMHLPLTLAYFTFYCLVVRLHEDTTMNFLLQSNFRDQINTIFSNANTIDGLWEALLGSAENQFAGVFFDQQRIDLGRSLQPETIDHQGDWGRIDVYNQIQGAVRFETSRKSTADFGVRPFACTGVINCQLCRTNLGFSAVGNSLRKSQNITYDCGDTGTRRLGQAAGSDGAELRRLALGRPELWSSMPELAQDENDRFRFWLYPFETQAEVQERLQYFRDRKWLDEDTQNVEIRMYVLNAELGRPRLTQIVISFAFSEGGGIYYSSDLQALFLQPFPGVALDYFMMVFVDLCFASVLLITTVINGRNLRKAVKDKEVCKYFTQLFNLCEWLIVLLGWINALVLYIKTDIEADIAKELEEVRRSDTTDDSFQFAVERLFDVASSGARLLENLRLMVALYSIFLMFRFFVSFGSQARLAVVTNTMKSVTTDLFHFLVVFSPPFLAFVISGNLTFGRRIEAFSTVTGSWGACLRIAFESEYDWEDMSVDYFFTAAIWTWSFIVFIVLVMINIALVVILDVYNAVRKNSALSEAVWETVWHFVLRLYHNRRWVPYHEIEETLEKDVADPLVRMCDFTKAFPSIPQVEMDLLFEECRKRMTWAAKKDLDQQSLLRVSGSIMVTAGKVNDQLKLINTEETVDPLKSWLTPSVRKSHAMLNDLDESFLTVQVGAKGGEHPHMEMPTDENDVTKQPTVEKKPEWLTELHQQLGEQRKWMEHAHQQMQDMQWRVQLAHMSTLQGAQHGTRDDVL